ncbi:MAG: sigma-E processing peptidase SpoIIGA [Clostridia bacterium]|nr:sigma-E processing peptidase SpoIIGA [Clostridia bacterium]
MNFFFDFLVLLIASRMGGIKIRLAKILISASAGAVFSVMAVLFPFMAALPFKLAVIAIMSFLAFGFISLKIYLRQNMILLAGFLLQGGCAGLLSFFGMGNVYEGIYRADFPLIYILLAAFAAGLTACLISGRIRAVRGKNIARIEVYKDGEVFKLTALYDSGNLCTDALTALPVILAEDVFPGIKAGENVFTTASGIGEMRVFYPDFLSVHMGSESFLGKDVAIGIIKGRLSEDGSFNALIGGICFDRLFKKADSPDFAS